MPNYILTNKAVEDLSTIWEYTFEVWPELQADKYYLMLFDVFDELAGGSIAGKKYNQVKKDILGFSAGKHIIFYRKWKANTIEIIRVLGSTMDLKSRIQE